MPKIFISGASGFIGRPLFAFLESQGHSVTALTRTEEGSLEGVDAVIHLAGEPLSLTRWTKAKRDKILYSRTLGTASLVARLAKHPPKVFISASAVGFYGDRGEEILTEESLGGHGFLADVCAQWEKASLPLKQWGARLVHARFGIVLGPHGGVVQKLLLPYQLGLGGWLGSGKQWISWIHLDDLIQALSFLLEHPLSGPINLVSPHPVRQQDFALTIAGLLHRPHWMRLPAWVLRALLGQAADELLLASTRVQPAKLLAANFPFQYADLRSAMYNALQI
ncbi:MAG: TIGR01777 family oxidoreductase [Verrucomicrobia bacterium]|nr:TIGR01777 family oxidoreductase [Verrucomicrobiota bacterium]MBU6446201.1 TIGR01777 family oxidoreductase [Verrucomicrobiota bacterium]MDE3047138.1 TIGR01777 family oxidoreductase [Verrucomicrobiota bacterium]